MKEAKNVPKLRFPDYTEDWEQRKLGDMADIVGGGTPSTAISEYWDGDINWFAPAEIADQIYIAASQRKITKTGYDNCSAKMLPVGTVLFTSRAGIGKTAILSNEACTNQGFQSIVPHENELDSYFIFSRTLELKKYGETVGAGSTFVEVSGKQMADMALMMPHTINEQRQIGEFFSRIDTLITLQQRKLDQIKEYKNGMLQKMFPKEGETVPEVRFPGFSGEWKRHKFGEITEIKSASRVHRDEWTTAGVPFYRSSDVMSALNGTDNTKAYISEELYEKLTLVSGKLEQGDILVTGGGSVGNPYKVPNNEPLYTKDADLLWVKRNKRLNPDFVYQYFLSPVFRDYLSSISHVGTIAHYTIIQLENTPVTLPTLEEQTQIGQYLNNLDTFITLHQRKLEAMKEYKKGLLQQMFV